MNCSLKENFQKVAHAWQTKNINRRITRYESEKLIGDAWKKSALPSYAYNDFEACGIQPLDFSVIPEHHFMISDYPKNIEEADEKQVGET